MRKLQKAAVVVAMLGSVGFVGAGTAAAGGHGPDIDVKQHSSCKSHDLNVNVLGGINILGNLLGNLFAEGENGNAYAKTGTSQDCSNHALGH
ncbi:hypothetical protein ACQUSR_10570 [Streptomyces sp. P1-3]|uniref:hypothetical protein n=1 Tax=unclassified Streptomyces TaxID=2593676 RepID=UPI0026F4749E|nr:hypothetical protein [Streptomyces sp. XD-27]WKX72498.1 hypothetical protein Q3Y56_23670 [Streptomyces sp. XD-27]